MPYQAVMRSVLAATFHRTGVTMSSSKQSSMRGVGAGLLRLTAFVGVLSVGLLSVAVHGLAYTMVPMNLEEMSAAAERIVAGVCTAREEGELPVSPGGPRVGYTQYTFRVTEAIKGNMGETLTIRQVRLGGRPRTGAAPTNGGAGRGIPLNPLPLPEYQPGQEVLLFLGGDSSLGLTSPVAMELAVFDIEAPAGEKVLRHRFANRWLFHNMSASRLEASRGLSRAEMELFPLKEHALPIPYTPFVSLIRKLAVRN